MSMKTRKPLQAELKVNDGTSMITGQKQFYILLEVNKSSLNQVAGKNPGTDVITILSVFARAQLANNFVRK